MALGLWFTDFTVSAGIAAQYHVSKYPTLKMFRYGSSAKREYRGQRSTDAIANFIREQLKNPITSITNLDELGGLDVSHDVNGRQFLP